VGAPYLRLISISRAVNVRSLRSAILAIPALAAFGSGPVWAEEDEYGSRAPFPAGPLRQIDDALKPYGIRPSLSYTGEVLGNASGGIQRGAIYGGRIDLGVDIDLGKLFGWSGTTFHANVVNNHGDGFSREYISNLMPVSNIEAINHTRLYELWIEKPLAMSHCGSASSALTSSSTPANMPAVCSTPRLAGRLSRAWIFPPEVQLPH
jgi:carbohydrate-selective porin OprB